MPRRRWPSTCKSVIHRAPPQTGVIVQLQAAQKASQPVWVPSRFSLLPTLRMTRLGTRFSMCVPFQPVLRPQLPHRPDSCSHCIWTLQRHFVEDNASKVRRSLFPRLVLYLRRKPHLHQWLTHHHHRAGMAIIVLTLMYTGTLHPKRTFKFLAGFQADQYHCVCHRIMLRTRCMTYLSQLEAADGFVSNGVGVRFHLCFLLTVRCLNASSSQLAPQDVQSIPSTSVQLPQPMANPTPSSRTQTISFIFTSSRQRTNLRDQNVIGVVAAGGRASTNNVLPNTLPAPSSSPSKTAHSPAVLTPEQTRVHALGAKHAIPAHSPFVQLAKSRSVSTVVGLPLQSPFSLSEEDLLDRNRKGIDFYMDAARLAKTRPSKESLSQPVTPISHLPSPSSSTLSLNDPVSSNTLMMFPRGTPNTRHAPLEALPIVVEPPAGLTHSASPGTSNTSSKKKRCSRSRTRKEPARQEGKPARPSFLNVRYTKYLVCHHKRSYLTLLMVFAGERS